MLNSLDRQRTACNALGATFTKTGRILSGDLGFSVKVGEPAKGIPLGTPAYSNGKNVTININELHNLGSRETLMEVQGLFWHEYCHTQFTPRTGTHIRNAVVSEHMGMTFNILEDQRIETLFTALYKPARHYFISMVLGYIMADKKGWDRAHVLMHGRRYMPKNIRDEFARRWSDPKSTKEVAAIIDEYRLLDLTVWSEQSTALDLIRRLHKILTNLPQSVQDKLGEDSDCQQGTQTEGQPSASTSSEASEKAKGETTEQDEKEEEGEDASGFWGEDEDDDDDDKESEDGEDGEKGADGGEPEEDRTDEDGQESGDGDSDDDEDGAGGGDESDEGDSDSDGDEGEDGDSDGSGSGEGDSDEDSDSDGDGDSETVTDGEEEADKGGGEEAGGGGKNTINNMSAQELKEEMEDVLNAISENEQIQEDARVLAGAMQDPRHFDMDSPSAKTMLVDIPDHIRRASENAGREFAKLYAEMEPGWEFGTEQGKLNVGRVMESDDPDTYFDEWNPGKQESSGLEVVIAMDISGSMSGYGLWGTNQKNIKGTPIEASCFAVWAIKRACESLDATVSVVGFGETTTTIIPRHDKARMDKAVYVKSLEPDTRPAEAFGIARWILSQSEMPHKLFVVVTDGQWGETAHPSRYISKSTVGYGGAGNQLKEVLEAIDGTRVYLGIGEECDRMYAPLFHVNKVITNAEDIVPVVRAAIVDLMKDSR